VGPLPGAGPLGGPAGIISDGSVATRWVAGHWSALTPAQRSAVLSDLVPVAEARASEAAAPYLAVAVHARQVIAADLGRDTPQSVKVVVAPARRRSPTVAVYSSSFDNNWGFAGPAAHCIIYVNPSLYSTVDSAQIGMSIAHEVFRCFQADDYPSVVAYGQAPSWLIEGSTEWVGESIYPVSDGWWVPYLTGIDESVFQRTYDAIGFFAHMAQTGRDPWKRLDAMLMSGTSAAAYTVGVNQDFLDTWASSLARQPFGSDWNTTGPGIPVDAYRPSISVVHDGTALHATVDAYANGVVAFDVAADIVEVTVSTTAAKMHEADGSQQNGSALRHVEFCVTSSCSACPNLASLERLPAGPTWLGVTGGSSGANYTVTGVKANCSACPVGSWTTTDYSFAYLGRSAAASPIAGGSGIKVVISPSGVLTIVLNKMSAFGVVGVGPGANSTGIGRFAGQETGLFPMPPASGAKSGTFAAPSARGVTLVYDLPPAQGGNVGPIGANPFGTSAEVSWQCSGSGMTFASSGAATTRWSLTRSP
jgi:hypothetical protein